MCDVCGCTICDVCNKTPAKCKCSGGPKRRAMKKSWPFP